MVLSGLMFESDNSIAITEATSISKQPTVAIHQNIKSPNPALIDNRTRSNGIVLVTAFFGDE